MSMPMILLAPVLSLLPQDEVKIRVVPRLVVKESWREAAAAQVGQGAFRSVEGEVPEPSLWKHVIEVRGRTYEVTAQRSEGRLSTVWVDPLRPGNTGARQRHDFTEEDWERSYVTVCLHEREHAFSLNLFVREGVPRVTVVTHYHHEVDFEVQGRSLRGLFIDMDLDGKVSMGDQWALLSSKQQEAVSPAALLFSSNLMTEPWYLGDQVLRPIRCAESHVDFVLEAAPIPVATFLVKRSARARKKFFEAYDETREAFLRERGIDPAREVDPNPPTWNHALELEGALALAREQKKPLLVEFGSDGCPWCVRYEWLNDKDIEVAKRLRRFTLVRINRDLDPNQTARALGFEGVPVHIVFDGDGKALQKARGWVPPRAQARWLDEVLEKLR